MFFLWQNLDKDTSVDLENGEAVGSSAPVEKKKPRLRSLDTFRGSVGPRNTSPLCALSVSWRVLTVSQLACVHCQAVWRVFIVSQLACVHCQSVGVCSLSVSWRVFIVSWFACVSLSISWRVYTASQLVYVHCQRVITVSLFTCVHCQSVRVCSLSIVTVNLVSCSDEGLSIRWSVRS